AVPAHLGRKATEAAQQADVEPDTGNVKIEEARLHQANEIGRREKLARLRQIERYQADGRSVGSHLRMIGEYDAGGGEGGNGGGGALHHLRAHAIVGGGEQHEIAADEAEAGIAGDVDPAIVRMPMNPQPWPLGGERLQARDAVVGRTVVDHHDLGGQHRLARDRGQRLLDQMTVVVVRDDDGKARAAAVGLVHGAQNYDFAPELATRVLSSRGRSGDAAWQGSQSRTCYPWHWRRWLRCSRA